MRTGRLTKSEQKYLLENAGKLTPSAMAAKLDRTVGLVEDFLRKNTVTQSPEKATQSPHAIRGELRASEQWARLKAELTNEELRFFEEAYIKLMSQFRNDVLASEEMQVFDAIKYEVLKSRNLAEQRKLIDTIAELDKESQTAKLLGKRDASGIIGQLSDARASLRDLVKELGALQERVDHLMKSLKSTRDQRLKEVESGKETVLGLFKLLQNREFVDREGRQAELMKLAALKERQRLGGLHEYVDGQLDRPILCADTVGEPDDPPSLSAAAEAALED